MGESLRSILGRYGTTTQTKTMKISDIIEIVAAEMDVDQDEITSKSRVQEVADARAVVQAVMRDRGWVLSRIGTVFGTDHHSILHNCRKIEQARAMVKAYDAVKTALTLSQPSG
jgi:chromosomal replication initiation ATPase DnaA